MEDDYLTNRFTISHLESKKNELDSRYRSDLIEGQLKMDPARYKKPKWNCNQYAVSGHVGVDHVRFEWAYLSSLQRLRVPLGT